MNPILQEALGAILRWGLAILAGYLVKAGIWTADAASGYVVAGTMALLALGWSLWQKYRSRLVLVTSLASTQPMTETQAKAKSLLPSAPSVTTAKDTIPEKS